MGEGAQELEPSSTAFLSPSAGSEFEAEQLESELVKHQAPAPTFLACQGTQQANSAKISP